MKLSDGFQTALLVGAFGIVLKYGDSWIARWTAKRKEKADTLTTATTTTASVTVAQIAQETDVYKLLHEMNQDCEERVKRLETRYAEAQADRAKLREELQEERIARREAEAESKKCIKELEFKITMMEDIFSEMGAATNRLHPAEKPVC